MTASGTPAPALAPTWEAPIIEVLEPLRHHAAVVIREVSPQRNPGKIVTRIELLSPSNKPGNRDFRAYEDKRIEAIQSGVPLVEIDYLHETPSPVRTLPVYPADANAYPYSTVVTDPRPDWQEGRVRVYGFGIDQPISPVPLPLTGDETLPFDLNAVYLHTFEGGHWSDLVNYEQELERLATYRSIDQTYIRELMGQIKTQTGAQD